MLLFVNFLDSESGVNSYVLLRPGWVYFEVIALRRAQRKNPKLKSCEIAISYAF